MTEAFVAAMSGSVRVVGSTLEQKAFWRMLWALMTTDFEVETANYPNLSNVSGRPT